MTRTDPLERIIVFCACGVEFSVPKGHTLHEKGKCLDCFLKEDVA